MNAADQAVTGISPENDHWPGKSMMRDVRQPAVEAEEFGAGELARDCFEDNIMI